MFERIVVGHDGSAPANAALHSAAELAKASGGKVYVVCAHGALVGPDYERMRASLPQELRAGFDPHAATHESLAEAMEFLREQGVAAETVEVEEHVVDAILDLADQVDADLIVVGNRGFSHARRLFMGSVSTRLAQHTGRSILIVHAADPGAP